MGDGDAEFGVLVPSNCGKPTWFPNASRGRSGRRLTGGIGQTIVRHCVLATLLGVVTADTGVPPGPGRATPCIGASVGVTQRISSVHVTPL
jgi:hypothetical protein